VIPDKPSLKKTFTDALALEWDIQSPLLAGKRIVSIYFGGGTPTLLPLDEIGRILDRVRNSPLSLAKDCEITIEANPEETSKDLFSGLQNLGINRLSLGVQSLDDRSLAILERGHAAQKAKEALFDAYDANIRNISIDLMYDLPNQTEASWQYSLDQIPSLPITHLSLYNLTVEPHTSFFKRRNTLSFPGEQTSLKLLQTAIHSLNANGLKRYEISAFAKEGNASHHNVGYWTARPFLGFGPSAFSFWDGERFRNQANLQRYARSLREDRSPVDFREKLPVDASIKERFVVQLRMLSGVDLSQFPPLPDDTLISIEKWVQDGSLIYKNEIVKLTERGALLYDSIATDLI
jgi:oxygen-independent coproporphyrinogen-3 oxidase